MTIGCMSLKMMVLFGFRDFRNAQVCNAMSLLDERARALLNYADPRDLTLRLKQEKHPARTRGSEKGRDHVRRLSHSWPVNRVT